MTTASPRLLCNLIYIHLRPTHGTDCTERGCTKECGWQRFHEWLDSPVTSWDAWADEVRRQRRDALLRGEIPA